MSISETTRLVTARSGDQQAFAELTTPYRRELLVHCYRLLGSLHDAEDLVQETLLRAWRRLDSFEGRASFRAWLYKIATHACLDALDSQSRRTLPGAISLTAAANTRAGEAELRWLEPFPDALLAGVESDPAARYDLHESISLAFLTILQTLPPRQRAVLLLRDVLGWQASEAANLLDLSVASVNSALHRARTTLGRQYVQQRVEGPHPPADAATRTLLERYVRAWETDDLVGLIALLKEDATASMPPLPLWLRGRADIQTFLAAEAFDAAAPQRWRARLMYANGQPALAFYRRDDAGSPYHAFAVQVVRTDEGQIADLVTFLDPTLFPAFALPAVLPNA